LPKLNVKAELRLMAERMTEEPAAVVADPMWRKLFAEDPECLAKTSPAFRLALLRHRFDTHPSDAWVPLRTATGGMPAWPTWAAPIFELRSNDDYGPEIIEGPLQPLVQGWAYALLARRGDAYWEITDGPERKGPFDMGAVVERFFSSPDADPREAMEVGEVSVFPEDGSEFGFYGVRLYNPSGVEIESPYAERYEEDFSLTDGESIADFEMRDGLFLRFAAKEETPRPLFAEPPHADDEWSSEGRVTCHWKSEYYLPVDASAPSGATWAYTKHEIALSTVLSGPSTGELAQDVWRYRCMADLADLLAEEISKKKVHQFLMPVYRSCFV
jgi:hypothetical protein